MTIMDRSQGRLAGIPHARPWITDALEGEEHPVAPDDPAQVLGVTTEAVDPEIGHVSLPVAGDEPGQCPEDEQKKPDADGEIDERLVGVDAPPAEERHQDVVRPIDDVAEPADVERDVQDREPGQVEESQSGQEKHDRPRTGRRRAGTSPPRRSRRGPLFPVANPATMRRTINPKQT